MGCLSCKEKARLRKEKLEERRRVLLEQGHETPIQTEPEILPPKPSGQSPDHHGIYK